MSVLVIGACAYLAGFATAWLALAVYIDRERRRRRTNE